MSTCDLSSLPFSTSWLFKELMGIETDGEIKFEQLFGGCFSKIFKVQLVKDSVVTCSVVIKLPSGDKLNEIANASCSGDGTDEQNTKVGEKGAELSWEEYSASIWLPFSHKNECRAFGALKDLDFSEFPAPKSYFAGFMPDSGAPALVMQDLTGVGKPLTRFFTPQVAQDIAKYLAHLHAYCFKTSEWRTHYVDANFNNEFARFWRQVRKLYTLENVEKISAAFADVQSLEKYFDPPRDQKKICEDVLVHGDIYPTNILTVNDRVTAIIDLQFSHAGQPAEDLTMMVTFLDDAVKGKELVLDAYWNELESLLDVVPFTKADLWKSFDQYILFALATSLLVVPFEINDDPPENRERLVKKAENKMKVLKSYDQLIKSGSLG